MQGLPVNGLAMVDNNDQHKEVVSQPTTVQPGQCSDDYLPIQTEEYQHQPSLLHLTQHSVPGWGACRLGAFAAAAPDSQISSFWACSNDTDAKGPQIVI